MAAPVLESLAPILFDVVGDVIDRTLPDSTAESLPVFRPTLPLGMGMSNPLWIRGNESSAGLLMMKTGSLSPVSLESFPIRIAGQADRRCARFL